MNFLQIFGQPPETQASASGRVNLLGEHTDYNDGFVLPTAIPQRTIVQIARSMDGQHHFYSENLNQRVTILDINYTPSGFASYIFGCIEILKHAGYKIPPFLLYVKSLVPMGSGLSSSAALEVATIRAIRQLLDLPINDVEIAQFAQQAEIHYVGVQCGIMDQMAASLANSESILFLDTRTLKYSLIPFPDGADILVIDSGVPRTLATSVYNQRRAECEEAAHMLGLKALRDIEDIQQIETLPEILKSRARHVFTENQRVLEVLSGVSSERFGELMNVSHKSLRDNYEVSIPALDTLVEILQNTEGVFGAKLTGAGFGGACVALVASAREKPVSADIKHILSQYQQAGYQGQVLVPVCVSG